jgi:simple sugar transport system substrate-binding protein
MRTWSRFLGALVLAVGLVVLVGFGEVTPVQAEGYTVYVVVHGGIAHPFWKVVEKGAKDAAALYPDLKVVYSGPDVYDFEKFMALVEAAIAAKPNGLIATITSHTAMDEPLRKAIKSGIPVLAINAPDPRPAAEKIPYLTYIGEDPYTMGALVAREMLKMMKAKGVEPKRGVYGNHHPGAINIEQRAKGFIDTLKAANVPAESVDVTANPVDGSEVLLAYLKAHPDVNMVQPAGTEHSEAFVARAVDEKLNLGKDIFVATIDLSPKVLDYVKEGKMLFTADQQQYLQGYLGVVNMYLYLKYGFVPPPLISTGEATATADKVDLVKGLVEKGYK